MGFGAGLAQGYATLGQIGFSERVWYTAIGTVCNVAARLCGEAKDGQILLSQRAGHRLQRAANRLSALSTAAVIEGPARSKRTQRKLGHGVGVGAPSFAYRAAGRIFGLKRKMFSGSYFRLISCRRP